MNKKMKRVLAGVLTASMVASVPAATQIGAYLQAATVKVGKVKTVKITRSSDGKAKIAVRKVSKANGYQFVYGSNAKLTKNKKTKTTTKTSITLTSLKNDKTYYVKIRAFRKVKGKKVYGAYTKVMKISKVKVVTTARPTESPAVTDPAQTETPVSSTVPTEVVTSTAPAITGTPQLQETPLPYATKEPEVATAQPEVSQSPVVTQTPEVSQNPVITQTPEITATPEAGSGAAVSASPQATKEPIETQAQFAGKVNFFGYRLLEQMGMESNSSMSPLSIAMALSMLDNGATNEGKKELEDILGISDLADWNNLAKAYIAGQPNTDKTKALLANSAWISDSSDHEFADTMSTVFQPALADYYQAESFVRNLTTDETKEEVNKWISDRTNGLIPNFLSEPFDKETAMVLFNTLYFKGQWAYAGEYYRNDAVKFYGKNGETTVPMFGMGDIYQKYATTGDLAVTELNYAENRYAMDVIIATDDTKNAPELFMKLTDAEKNALFEKLDASEMTRIERLSIPEFTFETEKMDVKKMLQNMGVTSIFDGENPGKLAIISDKAYVSDVLHKVKISVDKNGTEAAAVTEVAIKDATALPPEEKPIRFVADHPFVYAIRDKETGMILFMGCMQDIAQK